MSANFLIVWSKTVAYITKTPYIPFYTPLFVMVQNRLNNSNMWTDINILILPSFVGILCLHYCKRSWKILTIIPSNRDCFEEDKIVKKGVEPGLKRLTKDTKGSNYKVTVYGVPHHTHTHKCTLDPVTPSTLSITYLPPDESVRATLMREPVSTPHSHHVATTQLDSIG